MSNTPPTQPPQKKVWIKCRANEKCEGTHAFLVFAHDLSPGGAIDSTNAGRVIRYKCCTCGQSFHVRQ